MELIASSRIVKAQTRVEASRPYAEQVGAVSLVWKGGYELHIVIPAREADPVLPESDQPEEHQALAAFPHASVVLIVSEHVFRDIVRHGYGGLRPERFARVEVSMPDKEFAATAWVYVPDEDANQVIGLDDRSPEPATSVHPEPAAPAGPVPGGDTYHVTGNTNGPTHFGPGGVVIGTFNAGGSGE